MTLSKPLDTGQAQRGYINNLYLNPTVVEQTGLFGDLEDSGLPSEKNVVQPQNPLAKICPSCNSTFIQKKSFQVFCSKKCWAQLNKERISDYFYNEGKKCLECQKKIPNKNEGGRCQSCTNVYLAPRHHQHFINKQTERTSHITITPEREQIIIGSILGDATLTTSKRKSVKSIFCMFTETHCMEQKEYLEWKRDTLKLPHNSTQHTRKKNASITNYPVAYYGTTSLPQLLPYHQMFYSSGKKAVTMEILNKLTPLGIAVWYMDDGFYDGDQISIATEGFTYSEHKIMKNYFDKKWNLTLKISPKKYGKGDNVHRLYGLRFNSESSRKFIEIVRPHIIPSMLYKITPNLKRIQYKKDYGRNYHSTHREKFREYQRKSKNKIKNISRGMQLLFGGLQ